MRFHARPSVIDLCNAGETFTPVAAPRQPAIHSGFPSGSDSFLRSFGDISSPVTIAPSTESGIPDAVVKSIDTT